MPEDNTGTVLEKCRKVITEWNKQACSLPKDKWEGWFFLCAERNVLDPRSESRYIRYDIQVTDSKCYWKFSMAS